MRFAYLSAPRAGLDRRYVYLPYFVTDTVRLAMLLIFGIAFYVAVAIAVGLVASHRYERSTVGWFLLSLLISPVLALLFLIAASLPVESPPSVSSSIPPSSSATTSIARQTVGDAKWECTNCHQPVDADSANCPNCGARGKALSRPSRVRKVTSAG